MLLYSSPLAYTLSIYTSGTQGSFERFTASMKSDGKVGQRIVDLSYRNVCRRSWSSLEIKTIGWSMHDVTAFRMKTLEFRWLREISRQTLPTTNILRTRGKSLLPEERNARDPGDWRTSKAYLRDTNARFNNTVLREYSARDENSIRRKYRNSFNDDMLQRTPFRNS